MAYVAKRPLLFGDRLIQPGELVPLEAGRRYDILLDAEDIEEVPDVPPAPPPAQEPTQEQPAPEFVCDECRKVFPSEHGLKVHKTRVHWRP